MLLTTPMGRTRATLKAVKDGAGGFFIAIESDDVGKCELTLEPQEVAKLLAAMQETARRRKWVL